MNPRPKRSAALLCRVFAFWASLTSLILPSCSPDDPGEVLVVVNLHGLTPDVQKLHITSALDGRAGKDIDTDQPLQRALLYLPAGTTGMLVLGVDGLQDGCTLLRGQGRIAVTGQATRFDMEVDLQPLPAKLCTLTVNATGDGAVTSDPAGISCGKANPVCQYEFPLGTMVNLTVTAGPSTYAIAWTDGCSGPSCRITLSATTQVAVRIIPRSCSPAGWCYYNPVLPANPLRGLWGTSATNIWSIGDNGTLLHYDGIAWRADPQSGTLAPTISLRGIWGASATNIWVVGDAGTLLHYNGTTWSADPKSGVLTLSNFRSVWGTSATNIWAGGDNGSIVHYDGTTWTVDAAGSSLAMGQILQHVWGSVANDVWIVGSSTTILHYDGTAWAVDPKSGLIPAQSIYGIWGSRAKDVWAVGNAGSLAHYNGTTWSLVSSPLGPTMQLNYVWGSTASDVWAMGTGGTLVQLINTVWTVVNSGSTQSLNGMWGASARDVWIVGDNGIILRYQG